MAALNTVATTQRAGIPARQAGWYLHALHAVVAYMAPWPATLACKSSSSSSQSAQADQQVTPLLSRACLHQSCCPATVAACAPCCPANLQALGYRVCTFATIKTFLRSTFTQMQLQLQQQQAEVLGKQQCIMSSSAAGTRAAAAGQVDPRLYFCASYLAEMSLLESKLTPFPPSQIAAAAFASASLLVPGALHDAQLQQLTGYSLAQIKEPMTFLLSVHHVLYQGRHLPLTRMYETARKYRHASMCRVGFIPSISSTTDQRLRLYQ